MVGSPGGPRSDSLMFKMNILDRFSLDGRIALVTGGAGPRFGSSITEALAEAGATVISASRSLERNKVFVQQLQNRGFDAHAMRLDIGDPVSIEELHHEIIGAFGRLDVMVNSAHMGVGGGFEEQTYQDWIKSATGDMAGLFAICKAFVPEMVRSRSDGATFCRSLYRTCSHSAND